MVVAVVEVVAVVFEAVVDVVNVLAAVMVAVETVAEIADTGVVALTIFIALQRYDTALLFHLVLTHSVLKWLHHPLLKYVILLHPVVV